MKTDNNKYSKVKKVISKLSKYILLVVIMFLILSTDVSISINADHLSFHKNIPGALILVVSLAIYYVYKKLKDRKRNKEVKENDRCEQGD